MNGVFYTWTDRRIRQEKTKGVFESGEDVNMISGNKQESGNFHIKRHAQQE